MSDGRNISWIIYFLASVLLKLSLCYIQCTCLRPTCPFARPSSTAHWVFLDASTSLWTNPSYSITLHIPQPIIFLSPSFLKHFVSPYFPSCLVSSTSRAHHFPFDCRQGRALCPVLISYHLAVLLSFYYALKMEAAWSSEMFVKFQYIICCNILGGSFPHSHENFMSHALGDIWRLCIFALFNCISYEDNEKNY